MVINHLLTGMILQVVLGRVRTPQKFTLPETNSKFAPENRPLEKRFLLETTIFRGHVGFWECNSKSR